MVTPPFAAIEGTTFRLKTATTKRRTRSRRPRTRLRWGWAADSLVADWMAVDNGPRGSPRFADSFRLRSGHARAAVATSVVALHVGRTRLSDPHETFSVPLLLARAHCVLAALSPAMELCLRTRPDACRCRHRC